MQLEKRQYKKYDDQAFEDDLRNFQKGESTIRRDEVDVRKIIQTALMVEDESHALKSKHTGKRHESLYTDYKAPSEARQQSIIERNKKLVAEPKKQARKNSVAKPLTVDDKKIQQVQNKMISKIAKQDVEEDAAEDMVLAFELLSKYKKDKDYIQKEIKAVKKQGATVIQT